MKITDVRAAAVQGFGDWILVRVSTDEGLIGYGETFPTMPAKGRAMVELVEWMKDLLLGEDPLEIKKLRRKMHDRYFFRGGSPSGMVAMAIGGVEIALWDLKGKYLDVPVYELLGGKFRDRIELYADCHAGAAIDLTEAPRDYLEDKSIYEAEAYAEKAREAVAKGFRAVKFDIDIPTRFVTDPYNRHVNRAELEHLSSVVGAIRSAIGPRVGLAIDCHCAFDFDSALKIAREMEPYELLWLEEPLPPENTEALKKLTSLTRTPICTGENLFTKFGFKDVITQQAASIIEPDLLKAGGLWQSICIAELADLYYIPVAPHCVASPIGTMASVHACAAMSNFMILEYHMLEIPWWAELVKGGESFIRDGYLPVPDGPGLGIELDEEGLAKYLTEDKEFLK